MRKAEHRAAGALQAVIPGAVAFVKALARHVEWVGEVLREPVTPERAALAVRDRLARRDQTFLDMLDRAVFGFPQSPYLPLLAAAGYDRPRIASLVEREGVEGALQRLAHDGAYISIEEFKGTREVRRGSLAMRLDEARFRNRLRAGGLQVSSGGTRSRGIPTTIAASNQRLGAEHLALAVDAYGLASAPVAVYLTYAHGASLWAVLAFAALRNPVRWFTQRPPFRSWLSRKHVESLLRRLAARRFGAAVPGPEYIPPKQEGRIVQWLLRQAPSRCGVFTTPSSALRLALIARESGTRLDHVAFITIGETLTPAKRGAITGVGAQAFSSLGFTEFGRATYGCARPAQTDDTHVCRDAVAIIQHRRAVGDEHVDALLFTALRPDARRILLNVETGDYGVIKAHQCGCSLEQLGWTEHLHGIYSFEKLNAEGGLLFGSDLVSLVEEVLPARFGGDARDYQLLEEEDGDGFTRLSVVIHPRVGPIGEDGVVDCVSEFLRAKHRGMTLGKWQPHGTLRVRRAEPIMTRAAKVVPLHHVRAP